MNRGLKLVTTWQLHAGDDFLKNLDPMNRGLKRTGRYSGLAAVPLKNLDPMNRGLKLNLLIPLKEMECLKT